MKSVRWIVSYILVASLGLWLAFAVSMRFMSPARAQETPVTGQTEAPQNPVVPLPPAEVAAPSPSIEYVPQDVYPYDPTGKRDPFKPFRAIRAAGETPVELEPLQKYDINSLQVVGILWDVRTPRAMIRIPDSGMPKTVYTVTKNSKIGRNEGFVAVIREGEVVVIETIYEDGKTLKVPVSMTMGKKK